jgi:hypothetical protein
MQKTSQITGWRQAVLMLGLSVAVPMAANVALAQEEGGGDETARAEEKPQPLPAIGYVDSPMIPGTPWRVHDLHRPRPRIVSVPASNEPQTAPSDAIILFDGSDLSHWRKPGDKPGELLPAGWKIVDGVLEVVPKSGSIQTVDTFGDCQLHIEWSAPDTPESSSQARGNSGVILMGHYEIQVLDSYDNVTYADGQASAVYGQYPPMVNVTRAPTDWNVYDIIFKAPVFDGDKLVKPGYVTVFHNGVLVHYHRKIMGAVAHKGVAEYRPHPPAGSLVLQDHDNPTQFRNIWVRPLELED